MRIIISPAKKMRVDTDSLPVQTLPDFLPETERLLAALRAMTPEELQALWDCNDSIAAMNVERLAAMDLRRRLTPAILSYEGIQYQYMAPGVFEAEQYDFIQKHLRIVSGFYGLLRPFDGVTPYRLEMRAKLAVDGCKDLYAFWDDKLARRLAEEADFVLDLASQEYSRAVESYLPASVRLLHCTFGERRGSKIVEKGTLCKMARGQMVRWLAENNVTSPADIREFHDLGYRYDPAESAEGHCVFVKGEEPYGGISGI